MPSATNDPARRRADPVLVELTRGPLVESIHRGAAAVLAATGEVVAARGDIDRPVFVRSAAKQLQALARARQGRRTRSR